MNVSPGPTVKKGAGGSRSGLVTKLSSSSAKKEDDSATEKGKDGNEKNSFAKDKIGSRQQPDNMKASETETPIVHHVGPKTKKVTPDQSIDNHSSGVEVDKLTTSDTKEKQQQMLVEVVPPMPGDSVETDKDVTNTQTQEISKSKEEEDAEVAVPAISDTDNGQDKIATTVKPVNGNSKVVTEIDPCVNDNDTRSESTQKDPQGAFGVGPAAAEEEGKKLIPESGPPVEKDSMKAAAPVDPSEGKLEKPTGECARQPAADRPEVALSGEQTPPGVHPEVGPTPKQPKDLKEATVPPVEAGSDAQRVMEQFTSQLQRIEENFENERKEMKQQHETNIQQIIASKDQEMETLLSTVKEKDGKIRDLKRIKEGNELRMDSLKREVEGIKKLLEER